MPAGKHGAGKAAFSLVEMMIALAIAAFILVSIWASIGTAQSTIGIASGKATRARIAQNLFGEVLLSDWSSVGDYHRRDYYYDSEGERLVVDGEESGLLWAYRANLEISENQPEVPGAQTRMERPGSEGGESPPMMSRRVVVRITHSALRGYDFAKGKRHDTYATWLTKMDKM